MTWTSSMCPCNKHNIIVWT